MNLKEAHKIEALALHMYAMNRSSALDSLDLVDICLQSWRDPQAHELRSLWREEAINLNNLLAEAGLDVTTRTAPLARFLTRMVTQPATVMYSIETELGVNPTDKETPITNDT